MVSWRIGRRLGAYHKMTLILSRGRAHALRHISFRTFSAFQRISVCLHFTTDRQSLDGQRMGTDWRKAASGPASHMVLSDHWKSGLLSQAIAWAGLPADRGRASIRPEEHLGRCQAREIARKRLVSRSSKGFSQSTGAINAGPAYGFVRSLAVASVLSLTVIAVPANAQIPPYNDYAKAPTYYFDKANAGNAEAQFLLGLALEELGATAQAQWGSAESWIAKAAAAGIPEAQLRYGQIKLAAGDVASAKLLLVDAAASGVPEAQFNLGALAERSGDAKDARRWYWQAARQGYAPAQFNLALSLINLGGEAALTDALSWLILAAENDTPNAAAARDQVKAASNSAAITIAEKRASARR
jgi:hypothetical protein